MPRYAAYGSNLHPVRIELRAPSARVLGTARVDGYALEFTKRSEDGSAKATLVESTEGHAYVAVYELHDREVADLDRAESCGYGYDREPIDVGEYGRCFTYFAPPAYRDSSLSPYTWYRGLVLVGCQFHGFPETYTQCVAQHPAWEDVDRARIAANEAILQRARQRRG